MDRTASASGCRSLCPSSLCARGAEAAHVTHAINAAIIARHTIAESPLLPSHLQSPRLMWSRVNFTGNKLIRHVPGAFRTNYGRSAQTNGDKPPDVTHSPIIRTRRRAEIISSDRCRPCHNAFIGSLLRNKCAHYKEWLPLDASLALTQRLFHRFPVFTLLRGPSHIRTQSPALRMKTAN